MNFKMPKPVYQFILVLSLVAISFASCNNKKDKKDKEEPAKDTVVQKPVDGGNLTTPDGKMTGDTVAQKPVDGGN